MLAAGGQRKQSRRRATGILRPEDEAEVERLYQRLKTVGNLDQKNSRTRNSSWFVAAPAY